MNKPMNHIIDLLFLIAFISSFPTHPNIGRIMCLHRDGTSYIIVTES